MKLEEARKVLQEMLSWVAPDDLPKQGNALKRGIEAIERITDGREKGYDFFGHLLPGETEE